MEKNIIFNDDYSFFREIIFSNGEVKPDFEYIKVGNTIYTQDDDKQGWTGKERE